MKPAAFFYWAALLAAFPAAGQPLDCTALKTTLVPFAVDYQVTRSKPDGTALGQPTKEQSQIVRRAGETVAYTVSGPGRYLPGRSVHPLLASDSYFSQPPRTRTWSYSIDPTVDYVARRQPLDFTAEQKEADGKTYMSARVTINFLGTVSAEAQGCRFELVKVARTFQGTVEGKPLSNRSEIWMSPELRAALFTRIVDSNYMVTYTTMGITRDFKPVE